MSTGKGTLLVIGSGLKVYREYLIAPIRRRAGRPAWTWCCSTI